MGIKFNADEVLQMAVTIEENGAAFYRKAAESKKDSASTDFLISLADMEDGHAETFKALRSELSEGEKGETAYDPMNEAVLYLEAMADSHGGEGDPPAAEQLTGKETLSDILKIAIGLEKESILFYLGLKEMVPEHMGQARLDDIIKEERSHIVTLTKELKAL
jgi:rubrerythrin